MQFPLRVTNFRYRLPGIAVHSGACSEPEVVIKQTKAMGRDVFAIESATGELLGSARQTRKLGDLVKATRGAARTSTPLS